jgi:hypothetical protein
VQNRAAVFDVRHADPQKRGGESESGAAGVELRRVRVKIDSGEVEHRAGNLENDAANHPNDAGFSAFW